MRRGFAGGFVVCVVAAACIAVGVRAEQPSPSRQNSYLVQLSGPVPESWKAALVAEGAELQEYVPHFAFRARLRPEAAARVRRLSFVVSVEASRPNDKLARGLVRNGRRPYLVRLEPGADVPAIEGALTGAGIQVVRRGRATLLVVADAAQLDAVAAIDGVAALDNYALRVKHNEYGGGGIVGSAAANASGYDGSTQVIAIADTGLGTGTAAGAHVDLAPSRIQAIFNWPGVTDFCFETISNDGAPDLDTGHGTHVATAALGGGNASGVGRGAAPAASLVFQAVENYAVPSLLCNLIYGITDAYYLVGLPDDVGELFEQAYTAGARIHSDSWGTDVAGAYTADSANADTFVWQRRDMAITFSAGNSGVDADADGVVDDMSVTAPGTAKNVITVGASENDRQSHWECDPAQAHTACAAQGGQNTLFTWGSGFPDRYPVNPLRDDVSAGNAEQMAPFSSRGPTTDGRIKPDVVAPGTWNLSGYADPFQQGYDPLPNGTNGAWQYDGWGFPLDQYYKYMGGTSMAAPLVAGGAAVVRDYFQKVHAHQASAALVKATLINSAVDLLDENNDGVLDNAYPIPNQHEGWGRVDLAGATDGASLYFDEATPLSTATSSTQAFDVTTPGVPFKVTLAWTDYPASTSAATSLVNDLDLSVVAPDGTTYHGNVFNGGWSAAGGAPDRVNNVENVYVFAAAPGTWTVTVTGFNVPQGPQPFALVVDAVEPGGSLLPAVRVTVDEATAIEAGPTSGTLRFTRSGDTAAPLTVDYLVSGSAVSGSDFAALPGSITIPEGVADVTLAISAMDDGHYEQPETVVVAVAPSAAYRVGSPSSGTISIVSDDLPPDLVVTALTAPGNADAGESLEVGDTTRNQGGGPAVASATGFYLSTNSSWDTGDLLLGTRPVSALAAGATEAASSTIAIPASTAIGSYYLIAKADGAAAVDESLETNNTRVKVLRIGPDLMVSALIAPKTAAAGDSFPVTETTMNGGTAAPPSTTAFYLSINNLLDAGDVLLDSRVVPALAAAAAATAETVLTVPAATPVGSYYVLAQADSGGTITEVFETNNVRASGVLRVGADLTILSLTAPAAAGAGQVITVDVTTKNAGAAEAPESTTLLYWSANTVLDASDLPLGSRAVPPLDPAGVDPAAVEVTVPASAATGAYYLIAKADALNELVETTETNNLKTFKVMVGPDLTVTSVTAGDGEAGGTVSIVEVTKNSGGGPAPATGTAFFLSTNTVFDTGDTFLGTRPVPGLGAGESNSVPFEGVVPPGTPSGRYYVIAKADYSGAVTEVLESNNTRASALVEIGPDLTVPVLWAPFIVVRGTAMTISDTTRNDGGGGAPVTTTSYYLSVNGAVDASDVLLGSREIAALTPGATDSGQVVVVIPASQALGSYYLIAKGDAANAVSEASETNNIRVRTIRVNP